MTLKLSSSLRREEGCSRCSGLKNTGALDPREVCGGGVEAPSGLGRSETRKPGEIREWVLLENNRNVR